MIPSETASRRSRMAAEPAEVIGARNDDPDNPALGLGQSAESREKFLTVETKMSRTCLASFLHRAKFWIGQRA